MNVTIRLLLLVSIFTDFNPVSAQNSGHSSEQEIARLRKEILRVKSECRLMKDETKKDRLDFDGYNKRMEQRKHDLHLESDSLKQQIAREQKVSNDIAAEINRLQSRQTELDLSQGAIRTSLVGACSTLLVQLTGFPPLIRPALQASLDLLKNDLIAKTIDITEAVSRLVQIVALAEDAGSSIQTIQEHSPLPEIRGGAYRLRVGTLFEAVVDEKGQTCALFTGWNTDGAPDYLIIRKPEIAVEVLKAVNIREGRALPSFITLPLGADSLVEGAL